MARISFFQRFSQAENHATNNTLLVLQHMYRASPFKMQAVLSSFVEQDLEIGLQFEQQVRADQSVPDALITQQPLQIFIETKRGRSLDPDQVTRHIASIGRPGIGTANTILLGLTKEPLEKAELERYRAEARQAGITFAAATFSEVAEAISAQCAPHEADLLAIVDDYAQYLAEADLLDDRNRWLMVFPCSISLEENEKYGVYYEPAERPFKPYRFLGVYADKRVRFIGDVRTVIVAEPTNGELVFSMQAGERRPEDEELVARVIEESKYDLASGPHRFYLVGQFATTDFIKASRGGLWGFRYFDLAQFISGFERSRPYSAGEIAAALNGKSFE